jgi:hypothetical protein
LRFTLYINNLPATIHALLEPIIFADDKNVIISIKILMTHVLIQTWFSVMSKWFTANKLVQNLHKTNIIKFINNSQYAVSTGYNGKCTEVSVNVKFLGFQIDNDLNQKNHIHKLFIS